MNKDKQSEERNEAKKEETPLIPPKMRRIEIETDGDNIHLIKAEVSGRIELTAILQNLINFLNQPLQNKQVK